MLNYTYRPNKMTMKPKLKALDKKLNIDPADPIEIKKIDINFNDDIHEDIFEDYKIIREHLINSIAVGETVLEEAVHDLRNNLSARTIEACATILKQVVDSSEKTMNLHEKMRKLLPKEKGKETGDDKKTLKANINDIIDAVD